MNNIVLFQPEIPANTGNIARTCVGTNTRLHLIRPLGFSIDDKHVKRAGLDYWEHLDLVVWDSFDEFLEATNDKHYYLITKFGTKNYCDFDFQIQIMRISILFLVERQKVYQRNLERNIVNKHYVFQ